MEEIKDIGEERLKAAYRKAALRIVATQVDLEIEEDAEVELMPDEGGAYITVQPMWVNEDDLQEGDFAEEAPKETDGEV